MATTKKVTVSLPQELADALARFVAAGDRGGNVSAFVASAVRDKLDREQTLARLQQLWGDVDPALVARAEAGLVADAPATRLSA
jgi:Arc/MetJ-type ribon-helix-helix transcriptional regulator